MLTYLIALHLNSDRNGQIRKGLITYSSIKNREESKKPNVEGHKYSACETYVLFLQFCCMWF